MARLYGSKSDGRARRDSGLGGRARGNSGRAQGDNCRAQGDSGRGRGGNSRGGHCDSHRLGESGRGRGDNSYGGHGGGRGLIPFIGERPPSGTIYSCGRSQIDCGAHSGSTSHEVLRAEESHMIYGSGYYSDDDAHGDDFDEDDAHGDDAHVDDTHADDAHEDNHDADDVDHPSQPDSHVGDVSRNTSAG